MIWQGEMRLKNIVEIL